MLKDRAAAYYLSRFNCAEAITRAANDLWSLGLDETALRAFGGFGGGCACGLLCGAYSGCIAVLSLDMIETKAKETPELPDRLREFNAAFLKELGNTACLGLRNKYCREDERACVAVVERAAELLEQFLPPLR